MTPTEWVVFFYLLLLCLVIAIGGSIILVELFKDGIIIKPNKIKEKDHDAN